jgi:hypothetical protein
MPVQAEPWLEGGGCVTAGSVQVRAGDPWPAEPFNTHHWPAAQHSQQVTWFGLKLPPEGLMPWSMLPIQSSRPV